LALAFVVTSAGLLVGPSGAFAAAANDDFDAASVISSLPFSTSVDTTGATVQAGEPQFCSTVDDTVWYAITPPADATVVARASGGWPPAQLSVYRQDGSGFAGLTFLGCQDWSTESVVEHMQAGATYYVQASTLFFGRQLDISIEEVQVPGNDAFADASPDRVLHHATGRDREPIEMRVAMQHRQAAMFGGSRSDQRVGQRNAVIAVVALGELG
jgi:hypothetical protein